MIYPYDNATQTRWDKGELQVQLLVAGNPRPIGFCDGSEADVAESIARLGIELDVGVLDQPIGNDAVGPERRHDPDQPLLLLEQRQHLAVALRVGQLALDHLDVAIDLANRGEELRGEGRQHLDENGGRAVGFGRREPRGDRGRPARDRVDRTGRNHHAECDRAQRREPVGAGGEHPQHHQLVPAFAIDSRNLVDVERVGDQRRRQPIGDELPHRRVVGCLDVGPLHTLGDHTLGDRCFAHRGSMQWAPRRHHKEPLR